MKKIFSTAVALLLMGSIAFAQDTKTKTKVKTETKTETKAAPRLKKDGTPDMRYKENKMTKTETKKTTTKKMESK